MERVLGYLQTKEITFDQNTFSKRKPTDLLRLNQMLVLFKTGDIDSANNYANLLYNSPILLYKCVASLILAQIYGINHDFQTGMLFYQTALKSAPSEIIAEYVEKFKNDCI